MANELHMWQEFAVYIRNVLCCVTQLKTTSYIVISILDCNAGRLFVKHTERSWPTRSPTILNAWVLQQHFALFALTHLPDSKASSQSEDVLAMTTENRRAVCVVPKRERWSLQLLSARGVFFCGDNLLTQNGTRNAETDCTKRNGRIIIWWWLHKD